MDHHKLLLQFAAYNLWANTRFIDRLGGLSDGLLDRAVPSSFPSLRSTVLHIRDAEHVWWCRLTEARPSWPAEGSKEIGTLLPYSARLRDLVDGMSARSLTEERIYSDLKGNQHRQAAWQMLLHCFNHGTQHRGQLITMMRTLELGDIPANDLVVYQRSLT